MTPEERLYELRELYLNAPASGSTRVLAVLLSLSLVAVVLYLVRRRTLREEYTPIWLLVAFAIAAVSVPSAIALRVVSIPATINIRKKSWNSSRLNRSPSMSTSQGDTSRALPLMQLTPSPVKRSTES